jgi:hypothetical protein
LPQEETNPMRLHTKTTQFILAAFLFCATFAGFAQDQNANQPKPDPSLQSNQPVKNDSHCVVQGDNPGSPTDTQCVPGFAKLNIHIVEDARVADTVLTVGYTFAWDYPFA